MKIDLNIKEKLKNYTVAGFAFALFALGVFGLLPLKAKEVATTPTAAKTPTTVQKAAPVAVQKVASLAVVENPQKYLNKHVEMEAIFDKFSTLGLDYSKAMRSSQDYIAFLIQRSDVTDHNVPLSELKLLLKREYAEKFIELNTGDKIQISGTVFSTALGDAWIDVDKIVIKEKAKKDDTKKQ